MLCASNDTDGVQSKQYLTVHTLDDGTKLRTRAASPRFLSDSPSRLVSFLVYETFGIRSMRTCPSNPMTAHPTDIYSITPTPQTLITASGSSTIRIFSTTSPSSTPSADPSAAAPSTDPFPLVAELRSAHPIGCHHVAASADGRRFVSVGFGGEVKVWDAGDESGAEWKERQGTRIGSKSSSS